MSAVDIEYLKDRLDFEEVLASMGIDVSHFAGTWIMCHCPFTENHSNGDQNPSFGFNSDTMTYNCFVCGSGTLLALVERTMNYDEEQAVTFLTSLSSLEPDSKDTLVQKVKNILHPVIKTTVIPEFPSSAIKQFQDEIGEVEFYLEARDISLEIAEEVGLGFDQAHYGLVIPHRFEGKLRGWQIRHLLYDQGKFLCPTCKHPAKYTNTPNFPKKNTLFLYDLAVGMQVNVVESPLSALYLWSMGIANTMATFGSFSLEQAQLLKKFPKVRIWPDNDPAGIKNLYHVLDDLRKAVDVTIVPVVDKPHGDAADVPKSDLLTYLYSAHSPAILPHFKGELPTLEQVQSYI